MAAAGDLAGLLGRHRSVALRRILAARAAAWAAGVAPPGRVFAAVAPGGDAVDGRAVAGEAVVVECAGDTEGRRVASALERVGAAGGGDGPVLVAWPELAWWRPAHAHAALDDLRSGCDVTVGPVFDGGFYLLGLNRPIPGLLAAPDDGWLGPQAMGLVLAAAHAAGLQAGLLRAERGLHGEADVRAALADPLLDAELAGVLRG